MQMKRKRFLSLVLTVVMVICLMPSPTANAATISGGQVLYLTPNSNWTSSSAWFAAYFFSSSGNAWAKMVQHGNGVYEVVAPAGSWTNVIFCRMNSSATTCDWGSVWNQTNDLTFDGTKNLYTVAAGAWSNGSGSWSAHSHSTYTVAGVAALCGVDWAQANTANDMVLNSETGLYEKTFNTVAGGTHEFKIVGNHNWNCSWPHADANTSVTVGYALANVTIMFNPKNHEITTAVVCAHASHDADGICGACAQSVAHSWKDGVCSVCSLQCAHSVHDTNGICTVCAASVEHNYVNGFCTVCNFERAVQAQIGQTEYATLADALAAAEAGNTVQLLKQAEIASLVLMEEISLDLNGCTLTVGHVAAYPGSTVIDSLGGGLLKVDKNHVMLQKDNGYLPIWSSTDSGYVLTPCKKLNAKEDNKTEDSLTYKFLPSMGLDAYRLMAAGAQTSGVTMKVVVSWDKGSGLTGSTTFTYADGLLQTVYNSYDSEKGTFAEVFALGLSGISGKEGLTFTVYFESDTGVLLECKTATAE